MTIVGDIINICVGSSHSFLFQHFCNYGAIPTLVVELSCLKRQSLNAKHWLQIN